MPKILRPIFQPPDLAALRDAQAKRVEESQRIREMVVSPAYIHEIYGPASQDQYGPMDKLMETPDEVASRWGSGDYAIYDEMGRNVLPYRTAWDSRIDVLTGLQMVVLPGKKGDAESEAAAEEVSSHWENIDERMTALKQGARMIELGFTALENVWDVSPRGKSKGQFSIVDLIDHPVSWFGFDSKHRPYFKKTKFRSDPEAVGPYKVTWGRYGSQHSRYGRGGGQDCHPTVWTIDALIKGHLQALERAEFIPVVVTYPNDKASWPQGRVNALWREMHSRWKNVFMVPGEVTEPKVNELTNAVYANANASGASRVEMINMLVTFLKMQVQGMEYASNSGPGAYAKDRVADTARMYKAPGDAAAVEAMLNRGFVRPLMLANRPTMEESLWPRFAIDASFGEDLAQLLDIMERGVKMGVKIETVTFCDRFKIKGADLETNPDAELLTIREAPAVGVPGAPQPVPAPEPPADAIARVQRSFGEHGALIDVELHDGGHVFFDPGDPVFTENRGVVMRANLLTKGDVPVIPVSMVRRSA